MLTYEDYERDEWHLLMPDCVRESLATSYHAYLQMAEKGVKFPSPKELRMMAFMQHLMDAKDFLVRAWCEIIYGDKKLVNSLVE